MYLTFIYVFIYFIYLRALCRKKVLEKYTRQSPGVLNNARYIKQPFPKVLLALVIFHIYFVLDSPIFYKQTIWFTLPYAAWLGLGKLFFKPSITWSTGSLSRARIKGWVLQHGEFICNFKNTQNLFFLGHFLRDLF